ncbi:amidohydrolase family protein [candidate division KSB1 bacterium]
MRTFRIVMLSAILVLPFACEARNDIWHADYQPIAQLVTDTTEVLRARYPVIDVHSHLRRSDPAECIRIMDMTNVAAVVNLDSGWGENLKESHAKFSAAYPGRFITYARIDWSKNSEPGFSEAAAAQLEADYKAGARGLKISKRLGLGFKNADGSYLKIDDPRGDAVWAKCAELGIPVEIHVADPIAFFTPLDNRNERWTELKDNPGWLWSKPEYTHHTELLAARNRVIARHPNTIFSGAHMGNFPENLKVLAEWLEKYPNFHININARINELGRQPYSARKFLIKYQDRVMFGTDTRPDNPNKEKAFRMYFRFLETDDEYFDVAIAHKVQGEWMCHGMFLPDEVLKKIYNANALKMIPDSSI